jgi:hypothetical protein
LLVPSDAVPIVLLEGHTYTNAWVIPKVREGQVAKRQAQKAAFDALVNDEGIKNLHYVTG